MKKQNGITLVALVITIIILLILAGISIAALSNQGIFTKAKEAKNVQNDAAYKQNDTLDNYEAVINDYLPNATNQN